MKSKFIRFLVLWGAVFLVLYAVYGIWFASYFSKHIEPTNVKKYETKVGYFLNPEAAISEKGIQDASYYIVLNTIMNEWWTQEGDIAESINLVNNRAIVDRQGNVLMSGMYAAVTEQRSDLESNLQNHSASLIIGYMPIDDYFSEELIHLLDQHCTENQEAAVCVDKYGQDGMCYYPIHISLWNGESKVGEYDCLYDGEAVEGEAIWISAPAKIEWINAVNLADSKASLKKWCSSHTDILFSDQYEYTNSGIFRGFERYSLANNGELALVIRASISGSLLMKDVFWKAFFESLLGALVLFGLILLAGYLRHRNKRHQ